MMGADLEYGEQYKAQQHPHPNAYFPCSAQPVFSHQMH
jgi:hypothetical protein